MTYDEDEKESKKSGRWGYASYNVDDENDDRLIYTRYDDDNTVDKYADNGDGGHSHAHWDNTDDYNAGEDPDKYRDSSNRHKNPDTGNIQNDSGCYLTTACMQHFGDNFDDNCHELTVLRAFRDKYVSPEDIKHYYRVAPAIVKGLNNMPYSDFIYHYIYKNLVDKCVKLIESGNYEMAYYRYKRSVLNFEKKFVTQARKQNTEQTQLEQFTR